MRNSHIQMLKCRTFFTLPQAIIEMLIDTEVLTTEEFQDTSR